MNWRLCVPEKHDSFHLIKNFDHDLIEQWQTLVGWMHETDVRTDLVDTNTLVFCAVHSQITETCNENVHIGSFQTTPSLIVSNENLVKLEHAEYTPFITTDLRRLAKSSSLIRYIRWLISQHVMCTDYSGYEAKIQTVKLDDQYEENLEESLCGVGLQLGDMCTYVQITPTEFDTSLFPSSVMKCFKTSKSDDKDLEYLYQFAYYYQMNSEKQTQFIKHYVVLWHDWSKDSVHTYS